MESRSCFFSGSFVSITADSRFQVEENIAIKTRCRMILGLLSHDGSMGRTVYLPDPWMVDFHESNVAKYTVRPMDPMGIAMESFLAS